MTFNLKKCGVVAAFALSLSGCYMGFYENPQGGDYPRSGPKNRGQAANKAQTVDSNAAQTTQNTATSKDPVQKTTPGPKQTAAPQLPVIE